mmetsp:Transcript_23096/g.50277  ORF Transcript_23096/g.50277 Transcript_23096/m.50277 type:complete len:286 (+) Transcript_23096:56-913(+)
MPTEVIQHSELLNDSTRRNYQLPEKLKKNGKEGKSDPCTDAPRFSSTKTIPPQRRVVGPSMTQQPDIYGWIAKCYELQKENRVLSNAISELQLHLPPGVARAVLAEVAKQAKNTSRFMPLSRARHESLRAPLDKTESPRLAHLFRRAGTPVYGQQSLTNENMDSPRSPPPPPPRPTSPPFGRSPSGIKRAGGFVEEKRMHKKMNRVDTPTRPRSPPQVTSYDDDRKVRFSVPACFTDGTPDNPAQAGGSLPTGHLAKLYEAIIQKEATEETNPKDEKKIVSQEVG